MQLGHYTNTQGLLGIYQSKTLRATNIKFLNDEQEFVHALDLIRKIIVEADPKKATDKIDELEQFKKDITTKLTAINEYNSESIFTLSFSEKTDLLSQWRGYCPNNDGYCLVVETDNVMKEANEVFDECHFFKCVYDIKTKSEQIKELLNSCWNEYLMSQNKDKVIEEFRKKTLLLASHFKHPSFEEEAEYRIVVFVHFMPDEKLKFRQGRFSIVPFIEICIGDLNLIDRIIIGPTYRKDLAKRGLQCFLETTLDEAFFMINTDIETSEIPYRS